jgi:hypothetical protein
MASDHENRPAQGKAQLEMPFNRDDEEEDDLYESVIRMADRMQIKGKERQAYIHDHMTQGGYEQVQTRESYAKVKQAEEEGDGGGGSRWGFGGSSGGGSSRRSRRDSRDDDDGF